MSYWDTSALAKLYVQEPDSAGFEQQATSALLCVTGEWAVYEMHRVALRKESEGLIQPGGAETILKELDQDIANGDVRVVAMDARVRAEFKRMMAACYRHAPPHPVRTLDALHLATARVVGETTIVATDKRLRAAAKLLGFTLFPV
jgi:hypothetical protein